MGIGYIKYVQGVIAGWITSSFLHGSKRAAGGMFATACYAHCPVAWSAGSVIHGKTGAAAFGDWYFNRSSSNMYLDYSTSPERCSLALAVERNNSAVLV